MATENRLAKDRANKTVLARKVLVALGYGYSIGLFFAACALTLSIQGIAFSPLHQHLKRHLVKDSATATLTATARASASNR